MNVLQNFLAGREARRQSDAADRVNAMQSFMQEQGQAIFQGDQNALGQLAGLDPMMAMNIRQQQEQGQRAQASAGRDEWRFKKEMEQYAAGLSAQEAAKEATKMEKAVKAGLAAQSPQEWDALMQQLGHEEFVGRFGDRDAMVMQVLPMIEALKMKAGAMGEAFTLSQGQQRFDAQGRPIAAVPAASKPPGAPEVQTFYDEQTGLSYKAQWNPETNAWDRVGGVEAPSGTALSVDPATGAITFTQGKQGAGGGKLTEGQSKDNVFATRAEGALRALESGDPAALTSRGEVALDVLPLGIGRELQTEGFQTSQQRGNEFLQAILRKDTGAAITEPEQKLYGQTYLPQPGDGPAVLEAKRISRARAVEALRSGMSAEQVAQTEQALVEAARRTEQAPADQTKVNTKEEYDALPSGTVFMAPDGSRRVKP